MDGRGEDRVGRKGAALALLCVAQFVDVLDVNAVVVALHSIGEDLGFSRAACSGWFRPTCCSSRASCSCRGGWPTCGAGGGPSLRGLPCSRRLRCVAGSRSPRGCWWLRAPSRGSGRRSPAPAALSIITTIFEEGPERDRAVAAWTAVAAGGGGRPAPRRPHHGRFGLGVDLLRQRPRGRGGDLALLRAPPREPGPLGLPQAGPSRGRDRNRGAGAACPGAHADRSGGPRLAGHAGDAWPRPRVFRGLRVRGAPRRGSPGPSGALPPARAGWALPWSPSRSPPPPPR